ncbi:hypothetical protein K440DRAFT_628525 [Wilcoxina mikolae CBS 423.85]|nr:hypothetical protein K440DRAFT_628525 [Wilcoxina mikolae CBS 423.85]
MMRSPVRHQEGSLPVDPAKPQSTFLGGGCLKKKSPTPHIQSSSVKRRVCSGILARIIVYLNSFLCTVLYWWMRLGTSAVR